MTNDLWSHHFDLIDSHRYHNDSLTGDWKTEAYSIPHNKSKVTKKTQWTATHSKTQMMFNANYIRLNKTYSTLCGALTQFIVRGHLSMMSTRRGQVEVNACRRKRGQLYVYIFVLIWKNISSQTATRIQEQIAIRKLAKHNLAVALSEAPILPCGCPHRKLYPTDVILPSSHAKKLAFFVPEFCLWTEQKV